jgi:pre-mRNA-splicing factor CWC26
MASRQIDVVTRDKQGRIISHDLVDSKVKEINQKLLERVQKDYAEGNAQKNERENTVKALLEVSSQPFSRYVDDFTIETSRKSEIRVEDPMSSYFTEKQMKASRQNESLLGKRKYSGPNPTPNRFNLRPGYRWDGIDRSNGLEHKILVMLNEKSASKEESYKWSVSDL